ncbi:hypothetical protein Vafri_5665, partial [Volvox africanus]
MLNPTTYHLFHLKEYYWIRFKMPASSLARVVLPLARTFQNPFTQASWSSTILASLLDSSHLVFSRMKFGTAGASGAVHIRAYAGSGSSEDGSSSGGGGSCGGGGTGRARGRFWTEARQVPGTAIRMEKVRG